MAVSPFLAANSAYCTYARQLGLMCRNDTESRLRSASASADNFAGFTLTGGLGRFSHLSRSLDGGKDTPPVGWCLPFFSIQHPLFVLPVHQRLHHGGRARHHAIAFRKFLLLGLHAPDLFRARIVQIIERGLLNPDVGRGRLRNQFFQQEDNFLQGIGHARHVHVQFEEGHSLKENLSACGCETIFTSTTGTSMCEGTPSKWKA